MTVVLDLDGVVWLEGQRIGRADEAVALLQAHHDVWFVTNASLHPVGEQERRLAAIGIDGAGRVLTSATAMGAMVPAGARAVVCGGAGIHEALAAADAIVVDGPEADVVIVGLDPAFDEVTLDRCAASVRAGARLIGTNPDLTYPTPDGPRPGAGAMLAEVVAATGAVATIAGKPAQPMVDLVTARCGSGPGTVVGDRPDTDGALARALGWDFVQVLTGVGDGDEDPASGRVLDLWAAARRIVDDDR